MATHKVHDWIQEQLQVTEGRVTVVQIDPIKRQIFIKFDDPNCAQLIVQRTNGSVTCKHSTGEITTVQVDIVGLGLKRVRVANVPPESGQERFLNALTPYGKVTSVTEEKWSSAYRYPVLNGVRIVTISLQKHIPSHLTIAGYRALVSYEGQPATCYHCGETGHMYQGCTKRRGSGGAETRIQRRTWADIVADEDRAGEPVEPLCRAQEIVDAEQERDPVTEEPGGGMASGTEAEPSTIVTEKLSEGPEGATTASVVTNASPDMVVESDLTSNASDEMEEDDHPDEATQIINP
jgi:hypothetical protein